MIQECENQHVDVPREKKQTFKKIYDNLGNNTPKSKFIEQTAILTKKSKSTVRSWLCGAYQPDALTQSVIAQELGIPEDVLFPPTKEHSKK